MLVYLSLANKICRGKVIYSSIMFISLKKICKLNQNLIIRRYPCLDKRTRWFEKPFFPFSEERELNELYCAMYVFVISLSSDNNKANRTLNDRCNTLSQIIRVDRHSDRRI